MMKSVVVLCSAIAAVVCFPGDTYDPKYDNFDVSELIKNPRILQNYANCFLERGPCTPEGSDFKKVIPEALKTSCEKCTPKQKILVRQVVHAFQSKQPKTWDELVQKHDPKREYTESFNKFLNEQN